MRLAVLDLVSAPAVAGQLNEDAAGASPAAAWVIDGATDLGPPDLLGFSGAAWLSNEVNAGLHHALARHDEVGAAVRSALDVVRGRFLTAKRREPADRWELPFAAFIMVRVADENAELVWLADCIALIRRRDGRVERLGDRPERFDSETQDAARLGPLKDGAGELAAGAAPTLAYLRAERNRKNLEADKWLLGVEPEAADHLNRTTIDLADVGHILLMTDGLSAYVDKYRLGDDRALFDRVLSGDGVAGALTALRAVERADTDCVRFPRYKVSDDATGLLLTLV